MSKPRLPDLHDLVRLWRPTVVETVDTVEEHLKRRPPEITYGIARRNSRHAFARIFSWDTLDTACQQARLPIERRINREVLSELYLLGEARSVTCFDIHDKRIKRSPSFIRLRQDVQIGVSADFHYLEGRVSRIFWTQPRRSFALTDNQLGILASAIRHTLLLDADLFGPSYEATDLEIFDLSVPQGCKDRCPRRLFMSDLPLLPVGDVEQVLQRVVDAYDTVMAKDIDWVSYRRRPNKDTGPDIFP